MAYLGQGPFQEFSNPPTKDNFTGDGSTTAFDLDQEVPSGSQNALEVFVDNVRQEPGTGKAFILGVDGSGDHKRITFSTAPANGSAIYVINDKTNSTIVAPLSNDLNGTELILDVDGDTSITADTDDRIDLKIGNVEHISFGNSSGDTIIKPMTDAKDIMFRQFDGRDVLEINDAGFVALHNGTTGPGQLRFYEDDDNGSNFTAFQVGTQSADITYTLPTADGSSGQLLTTNGSGVLSFSSVSSAADDLTIGDAAVLLTTSAGNITIDAAGNDTDIIFKGTDGGSDRVFMTIDGSAGGDLFLTGGLIDLKNNGSNVSQIKFYCESSNAHAQTLIGAPHAQSADNTLTLPDGGNGVLLSTVSTATVTNKTFTSPKINEDVALTATATELNLLDTASANSVVNSKAVIYGSSGEVAGTLSTAAQANITSVGTLTALTVDDVAIDGKVITMTGSSSDTAVFTAAANGALSIVTTDAGGAAGNIQITADGTAELAGTTVTLDSGGGITLDADGGTITFADAGSSLGTITSSGYSGTAAVATAVTITDNESTNENNAIVFTAGGDVDGGNIGLEADGTLNYNPSTGTLTCTNLVTSGTHTVTNSVEMTANSTVVFEGATADTHETTLGAIDATGDRAINLPNVSGTLPVLAAVSATAITSTPAELNIMDGGTSASATTVVDADRVVLNDGGTMKQVAVTDLSAYFDDEITSMPNLTTAAALVTTGALGAGSIAAGFGAIDNGTSTIRSNIITAETGFRPAAQDGAALGTTSLQFSDLFLADAAVVGFGDDNEVTLTHIHDTGIRLNSTMKLQFNDGSQSIHAPSATILDIDATDEIELNATLVDINANVDISGTGLTTGVHTFTARDVHSGGITIANAGQIGSVGDADAIAIASNGVVTMTQIPVFSAGLNVSGGTIAGTLSTAAQGNITSLGTLTALTVDDITINGSTIADSGDFTIDCGGDIILDAAGGEIRLKDNTTATAVLGMSSSNFTLESQVSDKDIIFKGNDGGSSITALTIDMSAAGAATFNNDVTAFSDARLKDNVETIPNALDKVCAMRGVNYTRNDNNDQPGTGVIAQEMQEVFPVVVKQNDDELQTLSVNYGSMVGVLIEAIKELKQEIEELKGN